MISVFTLINNISNLHFQEADKGIIGNNCD